MPLFIILILIVFICDVFGKDGDWSDNSPEIQKWYRELMQPPPNFNISCCGEADAYWADLFEVTKDGEYIAIITDPRDVPNRPTINPGTRIVVPNQKLKFDAGNPTGHGVIFLQGENIYCYIVPAGI